MNVQQVIAPFPSFLFGLLGLALFSSLVSAQVANTPTLTHVPLFTFDGDSTDDFFGRSLSSAGDVNGDGFDDLIVGAPNVDTNGLSSGSARVISGADGIVLHNFNGDSTIDFLGGSVSGAGDVNADGVPDLIVGVPNDDNNGTDSGSARVLSGTDGSLLYNFDGDSHYGTFGYSVSGAGDVNGDGFADLIVGANERDSIGRNIGSARVFSGIDGSLLYNLDRDSLIESFFGISVSSAGDVNGDGFDDLIVGAPSDNHNGHQSGSARVFSGIDGSVLYNIYGDSATDFFGCSVSGAGDVNGDGFDDLIVGARGADKNGRNRGSARVISGIDGSVLYDFDGDSIEDNFGISVSGAGDANGDGFDDLIVGATRNNWRGVDSGSARVFSGSDGSLLYAFEGDSTDDSFGVSVSGAGDVNGDGLDDFVVGALYGGANNGGYARLFVSQTKILGDVDLSGEVTFADIPALIEVLRTGALLREADCNQDGVVDFDDIPDFIKILTNS